MIKELVDNLVIILKSTETKKFVHKSGENIATMCLNKDILSGGKQIADTVQYVSGVRDILFWDRMKAWLENTYSSPEMEIEIASKFTEDEAKYKQYTKRQIEYIAQTDEEEKIIYYSNLTRAWLIGLYDTAVYFKLAYLLKVFTLEELEYLKENFTENEMDEINFYIREFSLYGLIDVLENTNLGNSVYRYSDLSKVFVNCGLKYNESPELSKSKITLKDLKVENTRSCMEWYSGLR